MRQCYCDGCVCVQIPESGDQSLPALDEQEGSIYTVPANIRPVLSTYRLEVRLPACLSVCVCFKTLLTLLLSKTKTKARSQKMY